MGMPTRTMDEGSSDGDTPLEGAPELAPPVIDPMSKPTGGAAAGAPPASAADQRRARHRKVVKQSYYRKLVSSVC